MSNVEFLNSPAPHQALYAEGDIRREYQRFLSEGDIIDFFRRHPNVEWLNVPLAGGGVLKLMRSSLNC